jgi:CBS domain containing-hemolysin-like protein
MVPRPDISAIDITTPLNDVIRLVSQSPYSRLPVYRDSIDNIVGMLHTKDLVRWLVSGGTSETLTSVIRPIASIHESVTVDRVLRHLREHRTHQSLVVDEFGGTSGLITLEDVLSELLGDVGDEFKPGEPVAETLPDGRFRIPGSMPVEDAATFLDTTWETTAATVNGFITEALGHLPTPHEHVVIDDFEFQVEDVHRRTVVTVLARRISDATGEDGQAERPA